MSSSMSYSHPSFSRRKPRYATVSFCSSTSSAMPFLARAIGWSKLSWLKATVSAVPCTSTMPPAPVMTKFRSASAAGVLGVVEIENRRALIEAAGDGGDVIAQHAVLHHVAQLHPLDAVVEGDPGAGDGRGARAAVGLDDVAVDRDLPLAEDFGKSTTARRARPMRRCISACARTGYRRSPRARVRSVVARGGIAYSAVTSLGPGTGQGGMRSSRLAVQCTCVLPNLIRHEPSACMDTRARGRRGEARLADVWTGAWGLVNCCGVSFVSGDGAGKCAVIAAKRAPAATLRERHCGINLNRDGADGAWQPYQCAMCPGAPSYMLTDKPAISLFNRASLWDIFLCMATAIDRFPLFPETF